MDGWMDGWMDEWMDGGWMGRDGWYYISTLLLRNSVIFANPPASLNAVLQLPLKESEDDEELYIVSSCTYHH